MVQIPSDQIKSREILNWKGLHLFHFRTSSCSQKLRIYLNLKKISWTPHSINLATGKNYSEFFLGINPKGLVPVLVDDGRVEIESNDILMYLEDKFPENPLVPDSDTTEIGTLLKEEDDLHEDIRNIAYRYMFGGLGKKDPNELDAFEKYKSSNSELDYLKLKEVKFYKSFRENGITDEAVRNSLNNFCKFYDKYESLLNKQKYLMGNNLSMLDLAWFIYTYRLYVSGFPFKSKYPRISEWFHNLYSRDEFYREVNDPVTLKMIRAYAKISNSISRKSILSMLKS